MINKKKRKKRIMVDLTCSILHHGHIRLLKKASKIGRDVVALTSDEDIKKVKKFTSPLNFSQRKEILLSIKYVDQVVKSKWLITDSFLKKHNIDFLVHGNDNRNKIRNKYLKIFSRTKKISSTLIRSKIYKN
tara:strand:+ start:133 stop:528 length:396 start_codon:yes stop_codon:yes gene_type:complete